jgi:hypothetical protein
LLQFLQLLMWPFYHGNWHPLWRRLTSDEEQGTEKSLCWVWREFRGPNQTREEETKNGVTIRKQPSLLQRGQPRPAAGRGGSGGDVQYLAWKPAPTTASSLSLSLSLSRWRQIKSACEEEGQ